MCDITSHFLQTAQSLPKQGGAKPSRALLKPITALSPFISVCKIAVQLLNTSAGLVEEGTSSLLEESSFVTKRAALGGKVRTWAAVDSDLSRSLTQCNLQLQKLKQTVDTLTKEKDNQGLQHLNGVVLFLSDRYDTLFKRHSSLKMEKLNSALAERGGYRQRARPVPSPAPAPEKAEPKAILPPSKYAPKPSSGAPRPGEGSSGVFGVKDETFAAQTLSPHMQELLQRENLVLQTSLDTMVNQIRDVETNVAAVAEVQKLIAHNVMKQGEDIQLIAEQAVEAHENIVEGNVQLTQANRSGLNFRAFAIIFLLILSFTLLFLHWYE